MTTLQELCFLPKNEPPGCVGLENERKEEQTCQL